MLNRGTILTFLSLLIIDLFDSSKLLFQLHASVLKPNLDLSFRQTKSMSNFDSSSPGQVMIEVKLFF